MLCLVDPMCYISTGVRLPTGNRSMYGYFVDLESGTFITWDSLVPSTKSLIEKGAVITIGETMGVSSDNKRKRNEADIVPTVDIVRFSFLTGLLLLNKHPVLLTGPLTFFNSISAYSVFCI